MKLYIVATIIASFVAIPAIFSAASAAEEVANSRTQQMEEIEQIFGE